MPFFNTIYSYIFKLIFLKSLILFDVFILKEFSLFHNFTFIY